MVPESDFTCNFMHFLQAINMGLAGKATVIYSALFGLVSVTTGFLLYLYNSKSKKEKLVTVTDENSPAKASSGVTVVLTQSSDEGRAVSVLHNSTDNIRATSSDLQQTASESNREVDCSFTSVVDTKPQFHGDFSEADQLVVDETVISTNTIQSECAIGNVSDVASDVNNESLCLDSVSVAQDLSLAQCEQTNGDCLVLDSAPCPSCCDEKDDKCQSTLQADNSQEEDSHDVKTVSVSDSGVSSDIVEDQCASRLQHLDDAAAEQVSQPEAAEDGQNGAVTSPEQCQSSDSGVSIQSEAEVRIL